MKNQRVPVRLRSPLKLPVTEYASPRVLARVYVHVRGHAGLLPEAPPADLAGERAFFGVGALVGREQALELEGFGAESARVVGFLGVRSFVTLQVQVGGELLLANSAGVPLVGFVFACNEKQKK